MATYDEIKIYNHLMSLKRTNYKKMIIIHNKNIIFNIVGKINIENDGFELPSYSYLILSKLLLNLITDRFKEEKNLTLDKDNITYRLVLFPAINKKNDFSYIYLLANNKTLKEITYFSLTDIYGKKIKYRNYNNIIEIYSDIISN